MRITPSSTITAMNGSLAGSNISFSTSNGKVTAHLRGRGRRRRGGGLPRPRGGHRTPLDEAWIEKLRQMEKAWVDLQPSTRIKWEFYASETPINPTLPKPRLTNAANWFRKVNTLHLLSYNTITTDPPTAPPAIPFIRFTAPDQTPPNLNTFLIDHNIPDIDQYRIFFWATDPEPHLNSLPRGRQHRMQPQANILAANQPDPSGSFVTYTPRIPHNFISVQSFRAVLFPPSKAPSPPYYFFAKLRTN